MKKAVQRGAVPDVGGNPALPPSLGDESEKRIDGFKHKSRRLRAARALYLRCLQPKIIIRSISNSGTVFIDQLEQLKTLVLDQVLRDRVLSSTYPLTIYQPAPSPYKCRSSYGERFCRVDGPPHRPISIVFLRYFQTSKFKLHQPDPNGHEKKNQSPGNGDKSTGVSQIPHFLSEFQVYISKEEL